MLLRSLAPRAKPAFRSNMQSSVARSIHVTRAANQPSDAMPSEAEQLIKTDGYKYLDVRTKEEFAAGHAPSAANVPVVFPGAMGMSPNPNFLIQVKGIFPDPQEPLVVGCKSGRRSQVAISILSQEGYCNLVNLTGGFDLWAAQGLPVDK